MRIIISFIMALVCVVSCLATMTGCSRVRQRQQVARTLSDFMESMIELPDSAIRVLSGQSDTIAFPESINTYTMVIYCAPEDCSGCVISHIVEYEELFAWSEELGSFDLQIVFSPLVEEVKEVTSLLSVLDWDRPIYVDYKGSMKHRNVIPIEDRYHAFLLDRRKHPVFVGNPLHSKKMKDVFMEALTF